MSYQFDSRVRYSEIGMDQKLTLNAIVNYFQDSSTFHSEEVGLGLKNLTKRNRVWVLSSWQIVVDRYPELGEKITVQTWPYDFKGFYGSRNFALADENGKRIAYANSLWIFVDTETGHPAKISEAESDGYQLEEKLSMDYAPRKIPVPAECEQREPFPVLRCHLDTNRHVNNGQFIQMAEEYLPEAFMVHQVRVEYKKSAVLHDLIIPRVHAEEGRITTALCDEEEKPYAIVEFTAQA